MEQAGRAEAGRNGGHGGTAGEGGTGGGLVCSDGETRACYAGPDGTEGVGLCKAGQEACDPDGGGFGPCEGAVLPDTEDCQLTGDEDCDGVPCSEPIFVQQFGDSASQIGYAVAVDPTTGDVVVVGGFSSAMQIGDTVLTSVGAEDAFVAKLNPKGDVIWAKSFGDAKPQLVTAVAVAGDGSIVVAVANGGGSFSFGGEFASAAIVFAKLTANGGHKWTRQCGGDATGLLSAPRAIAIDPEGDVLGTGSVEGSLDCGNGSLVADGYDAFVVKLAGATGSALWSHAYGDDQGQAGWGIAADANSNVFVVGDLSGSADFGAGPLIASGTTDTFVAKLDEGGGTLWAKRFGDSEGTTARGVAVDSLGGPLIIGAFEGEVSFGNPSAPLTSNGGRDLYAAKLNAAGGHAWSTRLGDAPLSVAPTAAVAFDDAGDFVITGSFQGFVELGVDDFESNDVDCFVAKIEAQTGSFRWARHGDGAGNAVGRAIAVGKTHQIALTGSVSGTLDLGVTPITSAGGQDAFLALLWP